MNRILTWTAVVSLYLLSSNVVAAQVGLSRTQVHEVARTLEILAGLIGAVQLISLFNLGKTHWLRFGTTAHAVDGEEFHRSVERLSGALRLVFVSVVIQWLT